MDFGAEMQALLRSLLTDQPVATAYWRDQIPEAEVIVFVEAHLSEFARRRKLISVGSGAAELEHNLATSLDRHVICIDPSPSAFSKKEPLIRPTWASVKDMLAVTTPVNSTLLLIWPEFNGYDLEAIRLLRPHELFLLYEENGASGSAQLHEWLRDPDNGYTVGGLREWFRDLPLYGCMNYRLLYIQRNLPSAMKEAQELLSTQTHSKIALIGSYDQATVKGFEDLCNLRDHYDVNLCNIYIVVGNGMTVTPISNDGGFRSSDTLSRALERLRAWSPRDYHNVVLYIDPSYDPTDLLDSEWTIIKQ